MAEQVKNLGFRVDSTNCKTLYKKIYVESIKNPMTNEFYRCETILKISCNFHY